MECFKRTFRFENSKPDTQLEAKYWIGGKTMAGFAVGKRKLIQCSMFFFSLTLFYVPGNFLMQFSRKRDASVCFFLTNLCRQRTSACRYIEFRYNLLSSLRADIFMFSKFMKHDRLRTEFAAFHF